MKKITTITYVAVLAITILSTPTVLAGGCCSGGHKDKNTEQKVTSVSDQKLNKGTIANYVTLGTDLSRDDLDTAKKTAALIAKKEKANVVGIEAAKIANSVNIKSARSSFNKISEVVISAAKGSKSYKRAHCPMANGGKGGDWLQKASDKIISNPYFGSSMLRCGSFK